MQTHCFLNNSIAGEQEPEMTDHITESLQPLTTPSNVSANTVDVSPEKRSRDSPSIQTPLTIKVEEDDDLSDISRETCLASPAFPSRESILRDILNDDADETFDFQIPHPVSNLKFRIHYLHISLSSLMLDFFDTGERSFDIK